MTPFAPHAFTPKYEVFKEPKILLTPEVYSDQAIIVDESALEVGWLGIVEKFDLTFLIRKVFLLKQEVNSSTTELNPTAIAELGMKLIEEGAGVDLVNSLRYWGHSHHNMGTSPSGQDNDQVDEFMKNSCPYFIRGIANKAGRLEFTLYFENGFKCCDVPWSIYSPVSERNRDKWKTDIKEMVTEKKYEYYKGGDYYRGGGYNGAWSRPWWMESIKGHSPVCRCKKCLDHSLELLKTRGMSGQQGGLLGDGMGERGDW